MLGLDKTYRDLEKETYLEETKQVPILIDDLEGGVDFGFKVVNLRDNRKIADLKRLVSKDRYLDCACRLVEAQRRKKARIKDKTSNIVLGDYGLFVTLTFNEETMTKTDREKRRRLVQRYLKENATNYVANIDFGKKNGREHYHALVDASLNLENWHKYGAIKIEHIRATQKSADKVPQYIAKLTNHAIKETAGQIRMIYSRKPKKVAL